MVFKFGLARISIHSLVKRETTIATGDYQHVQDFNPLPRKEGDGKSFEYPVYMDLISIHSLVKRETLQLCGQLSIQH